MLLRSKFASACRWSCVIAGATLLAACSLGPQRDSAPPLPKDVSNFPDAVPKNEAKSRYGNPKSYVVFGKRYFTLDSADGFVERGIASWYGQKFHGRKTSSGEVYDMYAMTAAHKALPLPTYVRVTNLKNKRSVIVRVNDRGPFHDDRVIDLSYAAATKLQILRAGTALVDVRAIDLSGTVAVATPTQVSIPIATGETPQLFLQVGAFSVETNAVNLQRRIEEAVALVVRVKKVMSNGASIYQVQLGPVSSVEQADRLVGLLADVNIHNPLIVIE
jgi:rare lipoprotein A